MSGQQTGQPTERPRRTLRIRGWQVALGLVVLVGIAATVFAVTREEEPPAPAGPSGERLCELLESGRSAQDLVDSDEWRTWPEDWTSYARMSYLTGYAHTDCPELI